MDLSIIKSFVGKSVNLWPSDTYKKIVKILGADDSGILVQGVICPECKDKDFNKGQIHFLAWSRDIHFIPLDNF